MTSSPDIADAEPRITFGIIVLNGEPFLRYCLRQLYPHAHQIVVVEGGSRKAASFAPDGHSTDGTLAVLRAFKLNEDPDDKLVIVTRDGFWSEKDEQSQAYASVATGNWLWQIDVDEFYLHADIEKVRDILRVNPEITAASFRQIPFFGGPSYCFDSYNLRADNTSEYHRLFRWGEGYRYVTHRPPTIVDAAGVDVRTRKWLSADDTEKLGITLYHYSLLLPKQVRDKCAYYDNPGDDVSQAHNPGVVAWANECYFELNHPFRVHNVFSSISWLKRYDGAYPEEIQRMWQDIEAGIIDVEVRRHDDIDALLDKRSYRLAATLLTIFSNLCRLPVFNFAGRVIFGLARRIRRLVDRTVDEGLAAK